MAMPLLIQENNYIKIDEPSLGLKKGEIVLTHISGIESMSKSFVYNIECQSVHEDLLDRNLLGKFVKCTIDAKDSDTKIVTGYISSIEYLENTQSVLNKVYTYRMELISWLKVLDNSSDSRVFTEETLGDIINEVLDKPSNSKFIKKNFVSLSSKAYNTTIPVCVQYNESDGRFIARIIEECGFYFYFTHENRQHTLNVFDSFASYLQDPKITGLELKKNILEINQIKRKSLQVKQITQTNYSAQYDEHLNSSSKYVGDESSTNISLELYKHHETNSVTNSPSIENQIAATIIDSSQNIFTGITTYFNFSVAKMFTVTTGNKKKFVITEISFVAGLYEKAEINFSCRDINITFQSCFYPRMKMTGVHKAIVVGDTNGTTQSKDNTVLIKFHWDRYNIDKKNNIVNAISALVSQAWAGKDHGFHLLPLVGDDVYVEFAGGDPYQPIIIGSAYTESNPSKVDKKEKGTVHTFYTVGKNGFAFEDKDGEQCLDVVAEKDLKITAKEHITISQKKCDIIATETATVTVGKAVVKVDKSGSIEATAGVVKIKIDGDSGVMEVTGVKTTTIEGTVNLTTLNVESITATTMITSPVVMAPIVNGGVPVIV